MNSTKKTSVFANALIWFGAGVSIAEILTGTYYSTLGFGYVKALAQGYYGIGDVRLIEAVGLDIYEADIETILVQAEETIQEMVLD